MFSLEELFNFILDNDQTIVYGNLGRKSNVIFDYLAKNFPTFTIRVKSSIPIHRYSSYVPGDQCDLLVYLEPVPNTVVHLPPGVSHLVVFTSHLVLETLSAVYVSFYYTPTTIREEIVKNKTLLALQDSSVQSIRGLKNQINFLEVKTIGINNPDCDLSPLSPLVEKTFFIINICNAKSVVQLLLYIWDVLDYLRENIDKVERWLICFPDRKMKRYEIFVQQCINKLFCTQFLHGNVTCNAEILSLTPYYKMGVMNKTFECFINHFCKLKYINPEKDVDAFQACINYNLKSLTPQLFII